MMADCTSVSRIVPPERIRSAISAKGQVVRRLRDLLGLKVHLPLVVVPGRLELLDQVAGRDDLDAAAADQLDRAGVDPRDVRDWKPAVRIPSPRAGCRAAVRRRRLPALARADRRSCSPGKWSSAAVSMRCTSLRGAPLRRDEVEEPPAARAALHPGPAPAAPGRCCPGNRTAASHRGQIRARLR